MSSSPRDPTRLRLGLNPLTTSLGSLNGQHGTPISAFSMASPHIQQPMQTPQSAIQPYNPQEWMSSPAHPQERQSQYPPGTQVSPLPPPPYSPPRSQQPRPLSSVFDQSISTPSPPVPIPRLPSNLVRPSPEPQANVSFPPPPPGAGARGVSRERNRFGLPSLTRRSRELDQQHASSEATHHHTPPPSRHSIAPGMFYTSDLSRPGTSASNIQPAPPAARRAISAGAIETPTSARSRSGSQTRWESNHGIPPPPPGPPPSSSRSQSVQTMDRATVPIISPPTRRPPPSSGSALGPVPPTPADWVDDSTSQANRSEHRNLVIDTEVAQNSDQIPDPLLSSGSNGLSRAKAVRHDKTILQRRSDSRTRQNTPGSSDGRAQPGPISDIVVPQNSAAGPSHSGVLRQTPQTGESSAQMDSRNSTPRIQSGKLPRIDTTASPFTPYSGRLGSQTSGLTTNESKSKSHSTPPPRAASSSRKPRDCSRGPESLTVDKHLVITQSAEQFASDTVERFRQFAANEATCSDDANRVRLFADFIVTESRLRRERYSSAIGAMGSEIFDLTRDLFRPMVVPRRGSVTSPEDWTPDSTQPTPSKRASVSSIDQESTGPSSAPASGRPSPSPGGAGQVHGNPNAYMPSLSPILSMSVSEADSRGRPSSRWWEADSQGDGSRRFERSKRESKYMGVPKDQWVEAEPVASTSSQQSTYSEYPAEKTGWHDQEDAAATPQPSKFFLAPTSTPSPAPPSRNSLDVSRLVTLPPPYPRHHPAVNNNHPELTEIRVSVRSLSDLSEIGKIKENFTSNSSKRREEADKLANERRQALRVNLQQEISSGSMGYADAAAIEADLEAQENEKKKELEKAEYEQFQNDVIMPVNDLLTGRITRATELYDKLACRLFDNGQNDADMPQEEGDDRPELLEKLTLLKWIFEARETLHRAIYDILSDRNSRFREVVTTPYRLSGNTEKLKNAEAFFAEDAAKREYAFAIEVLDRTRDLREVLDKAVHRGVALQLSAFWDIAPPLYRLLEKIPTDLEGFNIQIPASEFDENPSYREHPMQYLLTLLLHTEKSTYQFIEAHTNLLCLLHEVKEAVVHAKARVLATQVEEADGTHIPPEKREEKSRVMRLSEEKQLTDDLKEKVRVVQDQWNSALAESIKGVKEAVAEWLLQTGGWDETLFEGDAIGGA